MSKFGAPCSILRCISTNSSAIRQSSGTRISQTIRTVATVPATSNAAPVQPPSSTTKSATSDTMSAATSGQPQPFSTPFFPKSKSNDAFLPATSSPRRGPSMLTSGTPLTALQYVKNPSKPLLAKEDDEYPPWLWTLLDPPPSIGASAALPGAQSAEDLSKLSKKSRSKYERKMAKLAEGMEKPIPLHEQSADITSEGDNAFTSLKKRQEITKSARAARRKDLREANFLRTM